MISLIANHINMSFSTIAYPIYSIYIYIHLHIYIYIYICHYKLLCHPQLRQLPLPRLFDFLVVQLRAERSWKIQSLGYRWATQSWMIGWWFQPLWEIPSGKLSYNYGKSPFLMGKLTISMAIFNSYVKLPEGKPFIVVLGLVYWAGLGGLHTGLAHEDMPKKAIQAVNGMLRLAIGSWC